VQTNDGSSLVRESAVEGTEARTKATKGSRKRGQVQRRGGATWLANGLEK
jgi:hypothetical protein